VKRISSLWAASAIVALSASGLAVIPSSPELMSSAATKFLESLTAEQRQQGTFAFASDERTHWHFIPTEGFPRNGLTIKAMTEPQRKLAHALLRTGMSQRGYLTVTEIMDLENVLNALESAARAAATQPPRGNALVRDPERYFFSVFGTPAPKGTWGWRVEGHHLSLNFTIVNGAFVAGSPAFMGTNPAEVREGPRKGARILAAQEEAARALLESLSEAQRAAAIIDTVAPPDIVTMNKLNIDPLSPAGIQSAALTAAQRALLVKLVDVYAGAMAVDVAADRRARIEKAGWGKVSFVWAGPLGRGLKHYYRVQGPTFLVEYDNTQNNGNHVHSVWRDFNGDFGVDLLREHVRGAPHF